MSLGLQLLSAISENGSTTTFRELDVQLLVDDDELNVYRYMREHYRRYGQLPSIETIAEETRVELPLVDETVDYYVGKVRDRRVYTEVRDEYGNLRQHIANSNIEGMMSSAGEIRRICTPYSSQQQELRTIADIAPNLLEDYDRSHARPGLSGVKTGWDYLDKETGGFQNGDFIVFPARPSVGKTWCLIHSARTAWLSGKSVLFVSMEMPLKRIASRFAAHHANLNPDYVRKGRLSYWGREYYQEALESLYGAHNFHLYAGNFKKTTADVDALIQELNPDVVYIDGIYLMRPANPSARAGRYEAAAYVVDELNQMALMRNRPVVTTTQFGRAAGKRGKEGSLENIGYTDAISTHATIVIGIQMGTTLSRPIIDLAQNSDGVYEQIIIGNRETTPYRILDIMKGREGESGKFAINFGFAPTRFTEVDIEIAMGGRREEGIDTTQTEHMLT